MRKTLRKLVAIGLCVAMGMALTACGGSGSKETRTIKIGTHYDQYYDSTHSDIWDNPNVTNEEIAQAQLDVVKKIEKKYNVKIEFVNLTYDGLKESINTSILAGTPDCDVYQVEMDFGIPAALKGYAMNLEEFLDKDSDIFTKKTVFEPINIGSEGVYLFRDNSKDMHYENTFMLAFNKQMLDELGLENPNTLYEKGEWTWDKWREYLMKLTRDTNGDGVVDVYGYGGPYEILVDNLLMSNGTGIAISEKENLTSPEVTEVLNFIYNMYNVDKVAAPWDHTDYEYNRTLHVDAKVGCWIDCTWMSHQNDNASFEYETVWCPWPIGPSGDQETNALKRSSYGHGYMIPTSVEDPELVYNVFYDLKNWFEDDTDFRDSDITWWEDGAVTEANFEVLDYVASRDGFDVWQALNIDWGWQWVQLMNGEMTPAQFQETFKYVVQDGLDTYYK